MALDTHRAAQEVSQQAAVLFRTGKAREARALFAEAAALEERALDMLPPKQIRTRGILAVSTVALYFKAASYERAETVAARLMTDHSLPAFARVQLCDLLSEIQQEQGVSRATDVLNAEAEPGVA